MDRLLFIFLVANLVGSMVCAVNVCENPGPAGKKLAWTLLLFIPLLGLLLYGLAYKAPSVKPEEEQVKFDITRFGDGA